jgi:hypothetical protein
LAVYRLQILWFVVREILIFYVDLANLCTVLFFHIYIKLFLFTVNAFFWETDVPVFYGVVRLKRGVLYAFDHT